MLSALVPNAVNGLKVCTLCRETKPADLDHFRCQRGPDGFRPRCKECEALPLGDGISDEEILERYGPLLDELQRDLEADPLTLIDIVNDRYRWGPKEAADLSR